MDSIAKKLKVVDAIAGAVGLTNITTEHIRVEELKSRKFDFVISRAVAPLKDLWKWSKPLIRSKKNRAESTELNVMDESGAPFNFPGLICLKGGDLAKEIQESNTRPRMIGIKTLFDETFFEDKFILYVTR